MVQSQLSITWVRQTSPPIVFLYNKTLFKKINSTHIFLVHMAGLVDRFGRDSEGLVLKMNQYLMCKIHDIYIGMNEPGWKVS